MAKGNQNVQTPAVQTQAAQAQTITVNGVQMDVTGFPKAAIDALLKAESDRVAAVEASNRKRAAGIRYAVGPSGTLVMTGISTRGLALYGGQWSTVREEVLSGRLDAALAANDSHLAYRDANGKNQPPREPLPNYGREGSVAAKDGEAKPLTLAERAEANAAATMAARDAAEAK